MPNLDIEVNLRSYWPLASDRQREFIEAVEKADGNQAQAERDMGVSKGVIARSIGRLKDLAVKRGFSPEHGMMDSVPEGFNVEKLSMLRRQPNGDPYWAIARKRREDDPVAHAKRLGEELRAEFEGAGAVGLYALANQTPPATNDRLVVDYEFGDPHFGMYADAEIVGEHFDTDRASQLTRNAIVKMVSEAPAARIAHLTWIGDNTHANDKKHVTPQSAAPLDIDPRGHGHALMAAARAAMFAVNAMLTKHETVVANILPGNHDPDAAFALAAMVAIAFEGNPRVKCDVTSRRIRMFEYGKVGLVYHHGDKIKLDKMPMLIAEDYREAWGRVTKWFAISGHIHHEKWIEVMGVLCRSLSTLAGKDNWHSNEGYRALEKTGFTVYDTRYGMDYHRPLGRTEIDAAAV